MFHYIFRHDGHYAMRADLRDRAITPLVVVANAAGSVIE